MKKWHTFLDDDVDYYPSLCFCVCLLRGILTSTISHEIARCRRLACETPSAIIKLMQGVSCAPALEQPRSPVR